jgi:trk system potassium uptake protein TrkA
VRVLIYGCGQLTSSIVWGLLEKATSITVLGHERSELERLSNYEKVSGVLLAEPVMQDYLMEAGIIHADAFLALSTDDHENLLAAQIASRMYNVPTVVCHVEDPQLQVIYESQELSKTREDMRVLSYSVGILQDILSAISVA